MKWKPLTRGKRMRMFCRSDRRITLARGVGFTFVELMIAAAIGSIVSLGLASMMLMTGRMEKSILSQQIALAQSVKSIETINREIRMATLPLVITDAGSDPVQGNRVDFNRRDEAAGRRAIMLDSTDSNFMTPGDNRLIFDPDTTRGGDEIVLARNISPLDEAGAFRYEGSTKPLQVRLRIGDPVGGSTNASNAVTGIQLQGVEINLFVAPRNDSSSI